jgi:decaprenylphospho-beta-D-erythro-pentofuranosid-2-ulose 2-reductase
MPTVVKNTLIIGATSAIASELASECAALGERLFLVGRDPEKLRAVVAAAGASVVGFAAGDFRELEQSATVVAQAQAALGSIDSVVIAHGLLPDQQETERSFAAAEEAFVVNLLSVVSFVIPLANLLESQQKGSLTVIGSVAGDRGRPRNYTYGAAKGGLAIYLQGVRSRLAPCGVRVVTIRLGPVDTPMTRSHRKSVLFAQPNDVAKTILAARDRGPDDVYVPWFWAPIMLGVRSLPEALFQRLRFLSGR